jgi:tetratricopeptide (TPR) repeat protein|tara:strand:- start:11922 stop:13337 length:1416 start_codon:yes stop_codon:yes gene_type:complete
MTDTEKIQNEDITKAINALSQNKFDEAEHLCQQVLRNSNNPDANHIIGCLRMREKKFDESIEYIKKAIKVKPNNLGFYASLGCAYSSIQNYPNAIDAFLSAIKLDPEASQVHFYLAEAYRQMEDFKKSLNHFQKCLDISKDHLGALLMSGIVQEELKHFNQAKELYLSCIDAYPDYVTAHVNLGMCYLLTGEYDKGWKEYEWRLKLDSKHYKHKFDKPQWNGEALDGKRLLVVCEQGFGDSIQFIRFTKILSDEGAKIIVIAQEELNCLLKNQQGVDEVYSFDDQIPDYDFYVYLLSIPRILEWEPKMNIQNFPYISVKNKPLDFLDANKINIGLLTQTRKETGDERTRSIELKKFNGFFDKKKHNVISLDYFSGETDKSIIDVSPNINDFIDTANIIQNVDLVISVDTVVAHIAGAMNKKVLVMLPAVPGWRWDLNFSDTTPWYPSMKLFRQPIHNDWDTVLKEIKSEIK